MERVAFDFIGVEVDEGCVFSVSESESSMFLWIVDFLTVGAISLNVSFWFSAKIFVRSEVTSILSDALISSLFSACYFGDLLAPPTKFSD